MQICGQAGIIGNGVRTSRIWQWVEGRELGGKIHFQPSVEIGKKNGMISYYGFRNNPSIHSRFPSVPTLPGLSQAD